SAVTARTVEDPRRAPRFARRAAVVASIAAVVAGGALAAWATLRNAPPQFEVQSMHRVPFGAAYGEYPSLAGDGATLVYDAADGKEDQVYRVDVASGTRTALTHGPGWHYAASLSPNGREVAFLKVDDGGAGAFVVPADGSAPPKLVASGTLTPSWSPRGDALWAGSKSAPKRYDLATSEVQRSLPPPEKGSYLTVLELPDGRVVTSLNVIGGRGIGIVVHDVDGATRWIWREPIEDALALVPGEPWVLAAKTNEAGLVELWQVPIDGGKARRVGGGDVAPRTGLTVAAKGDRLSWSTAHPTAVLARLSPSAPEAETLRAESLGDRRQWRDDLVRAVPGSSSVLVVSDRHGANDLWLVDPAGVEPPQALTEGGSVSTHAISRDGRSIAYATGTSGLFLRELGGAAEPRRLTEDPHDASPTFSSDGEVVYFSRGTGSAADVESVPRTGGVATRVIESPASAPEMSPDGRTLAYLSLLASGEMEVRAFDPSSRSTRRVAGFPPGAYVGLRFSDDGRRIAAYGSQTLVEVDVESGKVVHRFDPGIDEITGASYAGDAVLASLRVWEGDVWVADGAFH
ncbi:MAG TPA: hypothetical protein VL400_05515, partial [Polyangiaceae bacterium]|nr:hypothetical protein [Polyangiaceae bacterium]